MVVESFLICPIWIISYVNLSPLSTLPDDFSQDTYFKKWNRVQYYNATQQIFLTKRVYNFCTRSDIIGFKIFQIIEDAATKTDRLKLATFCSTFFCLKNVD